MTIAISDVVPSYSEAVMDASATKLWYTASANNNMYVGNIEANQTHFVSPGTSAKYFTVTSGKVIGLYPIDSSTCLVVALGTSTNSIHLYSVSPGAGSF
jgi:hypothetical protein